MTARKIPIHINGLEFKEQVSFAAGDPGAPYTAIEARGITFEPELTTIPNETQKPEANRLQDPQTTGGMGGVLTFSIAMRGGAGSESMFSLLAKNCGMDRVSRAGTTGAKVTGGSSSTLVALTADIGDYSVGDCIMLDDGSGTYQIRMVEKVEDATPTAPDTTLTVFPDWDAAPSGGEDLAQIDTIRPAADSGEPTKYMTFKGYRGAGSTDRHLYTMTGCTGTFKINTTTANSEPVAEFSMQVDSWVSTEASTTTTADAYSPSHPLLADPLHVDNAKVAVSSFGFDPAVSVQPCTTTEGAQGRDGWLFPGMSEPKIEIIPYWDRTWLDKWKNATAFELCFESIKDADEAWSFFAPKCQVLKVTQDDVGNEMVSATPEIQINDPGVGTDAGSDVNKPIWAIGITGA